MKLPRNFSVPAFSLVEVVVALGLMSFAIVGIVGLLPAGLRTMKESVGTTVQSQIAQQLINDAQLTPFSSLPSAKTNYFDWHGREVEEGSAEKVYKVCMEKVYATNSVTSQFSQNVAATLLLKISSTVSPAETGSYSFVLISND